MKEENNNYNLTRYACGLHQFKTQERFTLIKILNTQIIKLMETRLKTITINAHSAKVVINHGLPTLVLLKTQVSPIHLYTLHARLCVT